MKTSFKKLTSIVLAVLMLLSVFAVSVSAADTSAESTGTNTVYFAPGEANTANPAWFAWTWDGVTDQWVTGVQDGSYIRFDGCGNKIVFVRMPSGSTAGDWSTCWNQSDDITVSDNLATFSSWNGQKFNVTWSHYDGGGDNPPVTNPSTGGSGDLFLFGTIGTVDFGSGATEWNQPTAYDITSGTLTTTFSEEAYVGVKKLSTNTWYMADGFPGMDATSATLYDADKFQLGAKADKLHVPAGVEVTFSFSENGDGTASLSYTTGGEIPTQSTEQTQYTEPTQGGSGDLFLFGTTGPVDFGSGETERNQPTAYDITSGTLTTTFSEEAYVGVKKLSTNTWYMADGFPGMDATSATLYDADKFQLGTKADKLHVPAGVEVTFTFSENGDGTASLSYTTGGETPTQASQVTPTTPTQGGNVNLATDKFAVVVYDAVQQKDIGEFYMEGGHCTHTFDNNSYIFIRKYNGGVQYCLGSSSDVFSNPATFYQYGTSQADPSFPKMSVGGGDNELWLVDNGDGSYSLYINIDPTGSVTEPTQYSEETQASSETQQTQATQQSSETQQSQQTQATESGPADKLQASVKLNGTQVKLVDVTKSTLTVTYNLTADKLITDGDFALNYDSSKLTLTSVSTPAITGGNKATSPSYSSNPYLVNFTGVNQSTHSGIYNFTNGAVFATATFSVKSGVTGTAVVNLVIRELDGLVNDANTSYFADSQITTAGQTLLSSLGNPTVDAGTQPTQGSSETQQSQATQQSSETQQTQQTQATQGSSETQQTQATQQSSETQQTQQTQATQQSSETQQTTPTGSSQQTTPTQATQSTQTPTQGNQTKISLSCSKTTIYVNATTIVRATVTYGVGSTTFSSSNTKVATVNAAGLVTGKKAGSVTISVKNNGKVAAIKITVAKRANPMTVKAKTVKASAKKKTVIKKAKAFTIKKAKGKVTFKKLKGDKKITINKKNGKITVKKGLKKGKTYKFTVKVTAKGNTAYKAKSKKVTVKIKIK